MLKNAVRDPLFEAAQRNTPDLRSPVTCSGCGRVGYIEGPYAELPPLWAVRINNFVSAPGAWYAVDGCFCPACK